MTIQYDPAKIEGLAARMYASATATEYFSILLGLTVAVASAVIPVRLGDVRWQQYDLLIPGLLAFGLLLLLGKVAAAQQRGQAQLLLCQVQIERKLSALAVPAEEAAPVAVK